MRFRLLAIAALLAATMPAGAGDSGRVATFLDVGGSVLSGGLPVNDALVIAFGLSAQYDERASTNAFGQFSLAPLPVGVYRVIAVKRGFAPALAMVVPGKKEHRLSIRMKAETALTQSDRESAWEIRRALPRDVLREVQAILDAPDLRPEPAQRSGLAVDLTAIQGYDGFASDRTADRTMLALRGGVGQWSLDVNGRHQSIENAAAEIAGVAEAADVSVELRAPRGGAYRLVSSSASWQQALAGEADTAVQNHSIAWVGRQTRVSLRYFERENVFDGESGPSDGLELEGGRSLYRSERAGVGVHVRVAEETSLAAEPGGSSVIYAEVLTVGSFAPVQSLAMDYGLLTRAGRHGGVEYVPQASASLGSTKLARVTFCGAFKVASEQGSVAVAPLVTELGRIPASDSKFRYGVALSRELGRTGSVTASGTISEADNAAYVFFDDRFAEFYDGLYMERGDEVRSVALAASIALASVTLGFDAAAGEIAGHDEPMGARREYVVAAVRASHDGAGTTIDIAYRQLGQPIPEEERIYREVERASLVLAQSLRLPVDLRLMLGVALTRERDSSGTTTTEREATRLVGGLGFSF
ncbi:MAG: carboxypeptidase-like regulatory domain-containing protein [Thermoanaerobaculia bacterium]